MCVKLSDLKIPKDGTGRVLINIKNSLREYDAITNENERLVEYITGKYMA